MARLKSLHVTGPASGDAAADAALPEQFVRLHQIEDLLAPFSGSAHPRVTVGDTPSLALRLASGTQALSGFVRRKVSLVTNEGAIAEDLVTGGIYVPLGAGANQAARGSDVADLFTALAGKADIGHSHEISDIVDLEDQLDSKADASHSHAAATELVPGFMSAADKTKLDGLGAGTVVKYAETFPDGVLNTFIINHRLGTEDVIVQVRKTGVPQDVVDADITIVDGNNVLLSFAEPPVSGSRRVTIV